MFFFCYLQHFPCQFFKSVSVKLVSTEGRGRVACKVVRFFEMNIHNKIACDNVFTEILN